MSRPGLWLSPSVNIDIWSDIVCPFCYIGKRHLELALEQFPHRDQVTITWHSFQLDPTAPAEVTEPSSQMLARKYGMPLEQALANQRSLEQQAATVGLEYHLETTRTGNTFDIHRVLHLANEHGLGDEAQARFMRANFTDNEPVNDTEVLVRLATEVGLDEARVREVLAGDEFADAVRADIDQARAYGARGVPFFVLAEQYGVSGAQPVEVFARALEQAWAAANPLQMVTEGADGAVCEGDACAV
jgi:predicted DsbA family dithiol-disulfide isomerase